MKTTLIKKMNVNGEPVIATTDGMIIRIKKNSNAMKRAMTTGSDTRGYREVRIGGKVRTVHRLIAEAFLSDYSDNLDVDHIDGNKANNRIDNLRMSTKSQNSRAFQAKGSGTSSKYRGVSLCGISGNWRASIYNARHIHIGLFKDEIDAALAYDEAAIKLGYDKMALNSTNFSNLNAIITANTIKTMKHTEALLDYEITLANWHELGEEEYKAIVDELQYYYEEHGDYFTQVEFDIYNRADSLIGDAERFYEDEANQAELEQELDERRYAGMHHLS